MTLDVAKYIPWFPAAAAVLCGLCCCRKSWRVLAAPICILGLAASFVVTMLVSGRVNAFLPGSAAEIASHHVVKAFSWINFDTGGFSANVAYFLDPLTVIMLVVVTGVGTLVAIYAAGYMAGDRGYARFFAGVSLFIFAMTTLVMADNLVLLYLGWEGVGLCSYLLIGYYYGKPSAVAAAKKAFIVNRIGDLGFALGIFLIYYEFGTVQYSSLFAQLSVQSAGSDKLVQVIPFLLMLGAFGKSAQLPLYVWLPDAMEGPTPVSALIHAATMVTAGVYMIARLLPLFQLSPYALPTVAVVGGLTALFAATIALCQYDIKRIYAYSTISQLGYMFLGVGVASTVGGIFHLFTHAFFKALLFLTAGSVMHALAGQLDLRKMSGLRKKMPWTAGLMFVGCLALAGFPFTAGFYSKDMILAAAVEGGIGELGSKLFLALGVTGLFTAFLTAFYTFRLWFCVFMGPEQYEMGEEHHDEESSQVAQWPSGQVGDPSAAHAPTGPAGHSTAGPVDHSSPSPHGPEPHEVNWLMNGPLVVLALGALAAGYVGEYWIDGMVRGSTALPTPSPVEGSSHHAVFGLGIHGLLMILSSVIALSGIALAAYFHWFRRDAAGRVAARFPGIVRVLANKYYVDEFYDAIFVRPLRLAGEIFFVIDSLLIDGMVAGMGWIPRLLGLGAARTQRGKLQGYGLGMLAGVAVVALLIVRFMR